MKEKKNNIQVQDIVYRIKKKSSKKAMQTQEYFGIKNINSFGLSQPQIKLIAKDIGCNHELALQLWQTGIHEAKHIAVHIADKKLITDLIMEQWLKDFNSWDIVDNCCAVLFCYSTIAYNKVKEWSTRELEFEKRAAFSLLASLAVHDKQAADKKFLQHFSTIKKASNDDRNFVKKSVNWSLRQIGKRNIRLCNDVMILAEEIYKKGDPSSKWIASDALRELKKYKAEGKIKNIGL